MTIGVFLSMTWGGTSTTKEDTPLLRAPELGALMHFKAFVQVPCCVLQSSFHPHLGSITVADESLQPCGDWLPQQWAEGRESGHMKRPPPRIASAVTELRISGSFVLAQV